MVLNFSCPAVSHCSNKAYYLQLDLRFVDIYSFEPEIDSDGVDVDFVEGVVLIEGRLLRTGASGTTCQRWSGR